MTIMCPHCIENFWTPEPFQFTWITCPLCRQKIYVEVDETEDGPLFNFYKEDPGTTPCA